jgi:hypothetical protein
MKRHLPVLLALFIGSTLPLLQGVPAPLPLSGGAVAIPGGRADDHPARFDDHDRRAAHDYAERHRNDPGFRERDRLAPEYESRLREGYVMDKDMRRMCHPAPPDLVRGLAPCPHGYRYVVIGGHICLVDSHYRIYDTIHLEIGL